MTEEVIGDLFADKLIPTDHREKEVADKPKLIEIDRAEFGSAHRMVLERWFEDVDPNNIPEFNGEETNIGSLLSTAREKLSLTSGVETIEEQYARILKASYEQGLSSLIDELNAPELNPNTPNIEKVRKIVQYVSEFPGREEGSDSSFLLTSNPQKVLNRSAPGVVKQRLQTNTRPSLICQGRTAIAQALCNREARSLITMDCIFTGHVAFIVIDEDKVYYADPTEEERDKQLKELEHVSSQELTQAIENEEFFEINIDRDSPARILPQNIGLIKGVLDSQASIRLVEARNLPAGSSESNERYIASYLNKRLVLLLDPEDSIVEHDCESEEDRINSILQNL